MNIMQYTRTIITLLCAVAIGGCSPMDTPKPSGDNSIIVPSDTIHTGSNKDDFIKDSLPSGGKDHIGKDSLTIGGKGQITLPGFTNPTPIFPQKPVPSDKPNQDTPSDEPEFNEMLLGMWCATAYVRELRSEDMVERIDSVNFASPSALRFNINEDTTFTINHTTDEHQHTVQGTWSYIDGRLFIVYDSSNNWSETYMFDVTYNDNTTLILEMSKPQTIGTTSTEVCIIWFVH